MDQITLLEEIGKQIPLVGGMIIVIREIWKNFLKEKEQKEILADKVITNNIMIQEQIKDMIDLQKKIVDKLDEIKNGKAN
jgi:hypothetical protein